MPTDEQVTKGAPAGATKKATRSRRPAQLQKGLEKKAAADAARRSEMLKPAPAPVSDESLEKMSEAMASMVLATIGAFVGDGPTKDEVKSEAMALTAVAKRYGGNIAHIELLGLVATTAMVTTAMYQRGVDKRKEKAVAESGSGPGDRQSGRGKDGTPSANSPGVAASNGGR